ncbi:MAG: hypothetical protein U5R06_08845 [candidate division KSB1 bacterium]|nr:hypothetical protein [candidate division KSB1 bacterium]
MNPKTELIEEISAHFDEMIIKICNQLQKLSPSHYENIDFERHQEREEDFIHKVEHYLKINEPDDLLSYVRYLAEKRSNEGYTLEEVQQAFDIIEKELWRVITESSREHKDMINMLRVCRDLFARVRNEFARTYLKEQLKLQKRMNELKERFYIYRHDRKDRSENNEP